MNKTSNCMGLPFVQAAVILGAALLLVACPDKGARITLPDVPVNIVFDENGCPTTIDPNTIPTVNKASNQRIAWQAVSEDGKPLGTNYSIYFDPFKGRPIHTNDGSERSPRFDADIPVGVQYKYTIVADDCKNKPLDPRFFVN